MKLIEVKLKYHIEEIQKSHSIGLICPMCKIVHVKTFVTDKNILEKDLNKNINSEIQDFYYRHVQDCKGLK